MVAMICEIIFVFVPGAVAWETPDAAANRIPKMVVKMFFMFRSFCIVKKYYQPKVVGLISDLFPLPNRKYLYVRNKAMPIVIAIIQCFVFLLILIFYKDVIVSHTDPVKTHSLCNVRSYTIEPSTGDEIAFFCVVVILGGAKARVVLVTSSANLLPLPGATA